MLRKIPGHIKVDFHCHTEYSSDCLVKIEDIIKARKRKGLDKIAITDHGTIEGALIAKKMDPDGIIVGQEINVRDGGELLAFFVKEEVPKGIPAIEAIKELRKQGAFISVSHPFDKSRGKNWTPEELEKIIHKVDAIEGFNARVVFHSMNVRAIRFAKDHSKIYTVGSDAHSTYELGRANMVLRDFSSANELRAALKTAEVTFKYSASWVRLFSRFAFFMNKWKNRQKA